MAKAKAAQATISPVEIRNGLSPQKHVFARSGEVSRTQQNFKAECDINQIVLRYRKTGLIQHVNARRPEYGFASGDDFRESLELIRKGKELFESLPAKVRSHFDGSVEAWLDYVNDPENDSTLDDPGQLWDKLFPPAEPEGETPASEPASENPDPAPPT